MSWYDKGDGAADKEKNRRDSVVFQPDRFWMKNGSEAIIVFVPTSATGEDNGKVSLFAINEHNPRKEGTFMNWITCVNGVHSSDPCCEVDAKGRYWVGYHTIVDCREWVSKKGDRTQFELKLYPAKLDTSNLVKRRAQDLKKKDLSLAWAEFTVARDGEKSPAVGNDLSFNRHILPEKMFPHVMYKGKKLSDLYSEAMADPKKMDRLKKTFDVVTDENGNLLPVVPSFNYLEILKPKSVEEVRAHFRGFSPGGGFSRSSGSSGSSDNGTGSGDNSDDDIPF